MGGSRGHMRDRGHKRKSAVAGRLCSTAGRSAQRQAIHSIRICRFTKARGSRQCLDIANHPETSPRRSRDLFGPKAWKIAYTGKALRSTPGLQWLTSPGRAILLIAPPRNKRRRCLESGAVRMQRVRRVSRRPSPAQEALKCTRLILRSAFLRGLGHGVRKACGQTCPHERAGQAVATVQLYRDRDPGTRSSGLILHGRERGSCIYSHSSASPQSTAGLRLEGAREQGTCETWVQSASRPQNMMACVRAFCRLARTA